MSGKPANRPFSGASWLTGCRQGLTRFFSGFAPKENLTGQATEVPRSGAPASVDRFGGTLSVLSYDPENALFLLNNGGSTPATGLGRVYELNPVLYADEALCGLFERLLGVRLPEKSVLSVTLFASSGIERPVRDLVASRSKTRDSFPLLSAMAEHRAAMFMQCAATGKLRGAVYPVRHFRVWLTVTSDLGGVLPLSPVRDAEKIRAFVRSCDAVRAALSQFNLFSRAWDGDDYLETMREIVNPQYRIAGAENRFAHDASRALRDEVVRRDTALDIGRDKAVFSGAGVPPVESVALSVSSYPAAVHINAMGTLLGAGVSLPYPYLMSIAVVPTALHRDKAAVAMKVARVRQLKGTEIGQFLSDLDERERDLTIAEKACEAGTGLAKIAHELVVFAPQGRSGAALEAARTLLSQAGLTGELDMGLQLMGLMSVLPLEASRGLMKDRTAARHVCTKTRDAAAHLMPVLGCYRGTGTRVGTAEKAPMLMLTTREGELFGVDIFANRNGNYNALVIGTSGSGKSVLAQEIVMSMLATGGRVWVFDIGRSYQHCVEMTGGQWIDFEEGVPLCINPLDTVENPEDMIEEIAGIVTVMMNGDEPMEMTDAERLKLAILEVIREARSSGETPTLSALAQKLAASSSPGLKSAAVRLAAYARGGRYEHWFEGAGNIDFTAPLVVLEMQGLANKPTLQNVTLLILIMRIFEEIRKRPRSEKKLIVIDEAWRLLTGESGRFIEWACRTLRKYGAGIVCISQSMQDFEASGTARAVRMNADTVFLLRQKKESVMSYTGEPALQNALMTLTTQAELFSEVFVRVGDGAGVIARLALDPFSMTAYSTRSDIFEALEEAKKSGMTLVEAIEAVAREKVEGA